MLWKSVALHSAKGHVNLKWTEKQVELQKKRTRRDNFVIKSSRRKMEIRQRKVLASSSLHTQLMYMSHESWMLIINHSVCFHTTMFAAQRTGNTSHTTFAFLVFKCKDDASLPRVDDEVIAVISVQMVLSEWKPVVTDLKTKSYDIIMASEANLSHPDSSSTSWNFLSTLSQ